MQLQGCNYKVDNEIVYVQTYIYMFLLLMQHTQNSIKHAFFNKTYSLSLCRQTIQMAY